MCREIVLDGTFFHTMGELRTAIGDVPLLDGYRMPIPDHRVCLCPVDIKALVQSGKFTYGESDDPSVVYLQSTPTPMEKPE